MQGTGAYTHRGAAISAPMHKTRSRKFLMLLSVGKRTITDCQELLLVEEEVLLVVDGLLIFLGHGQCINWAALHTHPAKEAAGHVHIIFLGVSLDRRSRNFGRDDGDYARRTSGFAEVATYALFGVVV